MSLSEKILYMGHPEISVELIEKQGKLDVTPDLVQLIRLHHESWDGSGFKGIAGDSLPRTIRVLHIADDIVTYIHGKNYEQGFNEAVTYLSSLSGLKDEKLYDPSILTALTQVAG